MAKESFFSSSIGKKIIVGLTGLFLIFFLVVHVGINSTILINDGGKTFNAAAHFMAYNWVIRVFEVVLFAGFIIHILLTLRLYFGNRSKRPVAYAVVNGKANSSWYSRSMALLGSLLLIFLAIHINQFWSDKLTHVYINGEPDIDSYASVIEALKNPLNLAIYLIGFISLAYHLLHGFPSAFQTLGLNHKKYTPVIKAAGAAFSIVVPGLFAVIALAIFFGFVH